MYRRYRSGRRTAAGHSSGPTKPKDMISFLIFTCYLAAVAANAIHGDRLTELLTTPITVTDKEYSCPQPPDPHTVLNNFHIRGTALGGWLVLEPWLTPSLFYQFLGASKKWGDDAYKHVGLDSITFCTALGKSEANRQLRNHWKTWVTEDQIKKLADSGVDHLRVPVADWMFSPYEPFIGCWDGALEEMDRVLELCQKYKMKVLIDLHALRRSQNGLDNSGDTGHYQWIGNFSNSGAAIYEHWLMRGGDWVGPFNVRNGTYDSIDSDALLNSLGVVNAIVDRYQHNPVVMGIEPVNEPWDHIPLDVLLEYYWRSYQIVQMKAPHWITLLPDSFRLTPESFGGFLKNCNNFALDTHIYQAWAWENTARWFQEHACEDKERLMAMERIGVPIIVGEWSLATDNCAMWLNGLNDNVPGYPKVECQRVPCPAPYMGEQPGAPPDPTLPAQDPYGAGGRSFVEFGTCPRDKPFPNEQADVRTLSYAKLHAFDFQTHGQFFWNFRTEFETRWDYLRAVELGWLPTDWDSAATKHEIATACDAFKPQNASLTTSGAHQPVPPPPQQHAQSPPHGKKRSAMEILRNALLTLAIWIGVLALLLSVAACAARALGWLPTAEWLTPSNAYTAIPDKDADSYL